MGSATLRRYDRPGEELVVKRTTYSLPLRVLLVGLGIYALVSPTVARAARPVCEPAYDPSITSPAAAISGWPGRPATTEEIDAYVTGIATQTDRVVTRQFATSWKGKPVYYSLVGDAATVAAADEVAAVQQELRDPRLTDATRAAEIAAGSPAIAWYVGNVHGNEPAGGDAALQILYELAARTDCTAEALRGQLLVGVVATQSPDSRDAGTYTNAYGFSPNNDWFARTQPEIDGELAVLEQYPPVLLVDAHQQSGSSFFFPPNADPVFHEISPQSLHWINDLYGQALKQAFEDHRLTEPEQWSYSNYSRYDLFAAIYADSVSTLAFTAAGITFEKGVADPFEQQFEEHFVAGWTALLTGAENKEQILQQYYDAHVQALAEGHEGILAKNEVQQPGSVLENQVPDLTVRHYFLGTRRAADDADRLVARLLALGVEVYRLGQPLQVPDAQGYGSLATARVLPAGTYWIPMEQPQKRWIEAVLGEQTYPSVPYFFDVAAWSNPLLINLEAWFSGAELSPVATVVTDVLPPAVEPGAFHWFAGETARAVGAALALVREGLTVRRLPRLTVVEQATLPAGAFVVSGDAAAIGPITAHFGVSVHGADGAQPPGLAVTVPKIAVFDPYPWPAGYESYNQLRFFLEQVLELPWTRVTGPDVEAGQLTTDGIDVFIVPGVYTIFLAAASPTIKSWIESGGIFIGSARPGSTGGTSYAVFNGWTTARLSTPAGLDVPGSLFRLTLQPNSPVTLGAGLTGYWFHLGEQVLTRSTTGATPAIFVSHACGGDCRIDGAVTVDELVTMVDIALENRGLSRCTTGDLNDSGTITVDELVTGVNNVLNGCPTPQLWFSGYATGADVLLYSAGLIDEKLGAGRVVLFSGEPNFRAWTDGTEFLLANAVIYPEGAAMFAATDVRSPQAAEAVARARAAVEPAIGPGRPIRIRVPATQAEAALAVIERFTGEVTLRPAGDTAVLEIANPDGLTPDEHPFSRLLLPALGHAGIEVLYAAL